MTQSHPSASPSPSLQLPTKGPEGLNEKNPDIVHEVQDSTNSSVALVSIDAPEVANALVEIVKSSPPTRFSTFSTKDLLQSIDQEPEKLLVPLDNLSLPTATLVAALRGALYVVAMVKQYLKYPKKGDSYPGFSRTTALATLQAAMYVTATLVQQLSNLKKGKKLHEF